MRTNTLLTRCKQRAVHYLAMRTNTLLTRCKQRAVHYLAMRTNTHQTKCATIPFPLRPPPAATTYFAFST